MKQRVVEIVEVQTPERPAGVTRPNTAAEALAIMKQHEKQIVLVDIPYEPIDATGTHPASVETARKRFDESPWW